MCNCLWLNPTKSVFTILVKLENGLLQELMLDSILNWSFVKQTSTWLMTMTLSQKWNSPKNGMVPLSANSRVVWVQLVFVIYLLKNKTVVH